MAFNYARPGQSPYGASIQQNTDHQPQARAHVGPDLQEIQTESLGFLSIAGDSKIRLLPSAWPLDNLPPPTSSLLSVASQTGLLAAAGPDSVVIASTDAVRSAFETSVDADTRVRPFQPQMTLQLNIRVSQVVFTADEKYLILSAESGGGLAIYDVQGMLGGSSKTAFEMSTNGLAVRALVTNPTQEKGELVAIITTDGKLMMANLNDRKFVEGTRGQILKDHVSCVAWSTRGKQLIAGLADGSAFQMTPIGECKAELPRPPGLETNYHVSSVSWLENNVFLMVYTPTSFDSSGAPSSVFFIVTRLSPNEFQFQKITDPTTPFGLNRSPPHHFILRLKDFPPNLQDLLVVASTASTDIGLLSRSKTPLASDKAAESITDVFTMTELADDSRRAALPVADNADDTSPIGLALDLSSRQNVVKPIPSDEMGESKTPVPNLMVLNNDGVLSSWWIIYSDSVKQGMIYPALVAANDTKPSAGTSMSNDTTIQHNATAQKGITERFSPSFEPTAKSFSSFGSRPGLGTSSAAAFGAPSILSKTPSLWGTLGGGQQSSSGTTASQSASAMLGKPATTSVAFGTSAFPGNRVSPWATAQSKPVIGVTSDTRDIGHGAQSVFGLGSNAKPFGSGNSGGGGGFAAFASKSGGFPTTPVTTGASHTPFDPTAVHKSFAAPVSDVNLDRNFSSGMFGALPKNESDVTTFETQAFKLGTTFTAERSSEADTPKMTTNMGGAMFGSDFESALGTQTTMDVPEANMEEDEPEGAVPAVLQVSDEPADTGKLRPPPPDFNLPESTSAQVAVRDKFSGQSFPHALGNGSSSDLDSEGFPVAVTKPGTFASDNQTTKKDTQLDSGSTANTLGPLKISHGHMKAVQQESIIKEEPASDNSSSKELRQIRELPLPSGSINKTESGEGDCSSPPTATDAPLPPDFVLSQSMAKKETIPAQSDLASSDASAKKSEDIASSPSRDQAETLSIGHLQSTTEQLSPDHGDAAREDTHFESHDGVEGEHDSDFETEEDDDYSQSDKADDIAAGLSSPGSRDDRDIRSTFQSGNSGTNERLLSTKAAPATTTAAVRPLFGEIGDETPPNLHPPRGMSTSSRSPSPVRRLGHARTRTSDKSRAPDQASRTLGSNMLLSESPNSAASQLKKSRQRLVASRADEEAEAMQAFVDQDDESTQRYLAQPLQGTTRLDEFVAHQDYVGEPDKDSIPSQTEAVFRDINSMVDTLGINVRALQNFMKGHIENYREPPRTKTDLADDTEWCLVEIRTLYDIVIDELCQDLQHGSMTEISTIMAACRGVERDLSKVRMRTTDVKTLLGAQLDHSRIESMEVRPLSTEQAAQQHNLRQHLLQLQKLLNETEESLTILRTKLVSHQNPNRAKSSSGPTVEAVLRTIAKMISMAEKRSGDVDVLENQMRQLRMSSEVSNGNLEFSSSVALDVSTPYRLDHLAGSARVRASESARGSPSPFKLSTSVSNGLNTTQSPRGKRLNGFSIDEKELLSRKAAQKTAAMEELKVVIRRLGPRLTVLNGVSPDGAK